MAVEDGRSFNHEFYSIKQKNDKMRSLLVEQKSDLKRLMNIEVKHDLLQEKLDDILSEKIEAKKTQMIIDYKKRLSLQAHFDESTTQYLAN